MKINQTIPVPNQMLSIFFERKRRRNRHYSASALARDLGVSPAFVSQLLKGTKKISYSRAQEISKRLGLSEKESRTFVSSVVRQKIHITSGEDKFQLNLQGIGLQEDKFVEFPADRFELIGDWCHNAILDLTECSNFVPDLTWIAKRLGISVSAVTNAVHRLLRAGLLKIENQRWNKVPRQVFFQTTESIRAVREYHRSTIDKALKELSNTSAEAFDVRSITSISIPSDVSKLPEVFKEIENFQKRMATFLSDGDATEVFQLNVQLFKVTNNLDLNETSKKENK